MAKPKPKPGPRVHGRVVDDAQEFLTARMRVLFWESEWSLAELARRANTNYAQVSSIMSGDKRMGLSLAIRLFGALGCYLTVVPKDE